MRVFSLAVLVVASTASAEKPKLLSPKELLARVEASPVTFQLESTEDPPTQWFQQDLSWIYPRAPDVPPVVIVVKGKLLPYERPEALRAALAEVEPHFEAKRYAAAEAGYGALVAKYPKDGTLQLDWGDAALFGGKPKEALARYEAATALLPSDFRGWYYQGNALLELGRPADALNRYVHALMLRPHNRSVELGLDPRAAKLGRTLTREWFWPGARVEVLDAENARVTVSSRAGAAWLGWGLCKALWRSDPAFRKEMSGSSERMAFDLREERMCLAALLTAYEGRPPKEPEDPVIERIEAALKAGLLDELILYELASRNGTAVTAMLSEQHQQALERYVRQFILPVAK